MTDSPAGPSPERAGRHRAPAGSGRSAPGPWFTRKRLVVPAGVAVLAVAVAVLVNPFAPAAAPSASSTPRGSATAASSRSPAATSTPTPSASPGRPTATPSATGATPGATPAARPAGISGDGVHDVGSDIRPGLYRSEGTGTWERLEDASGDIESVIANGEASGVEYVQVKASDGFFSTRGMGDWVLVDPTAKGPRATTFAGDGTYLVGVDILPGTYASSGTGFWKRLKSASGEYGDIIANDNATGRTVVTIERTDRFFTTRGMGTWVRVP